MNADLERVIALQRLVTAAHDAERRVAEEPEREKALNARIEIGRERVAVAKARLADNQAARREIEKDVAVHHGRLSKFREQAMAVKTNEEYHAIQKEIGFAQRSFTEQEIVERMVAHPKGGSKVRAVPEATGTNRLGYLAPFAFLAAAAVVLVLVLRSVIRRPSRDHVPAGQNGESPPPDEEEAVLAGEEIAR